MEHVRRGPGAARGGRGAPPAGGPGADPVRRLFDAWAAGGRAELMEREHRGSVMRFLGRADLGGPFTFLDIGCGNGWVVRAVAGLDACRGAVGIDKSAGMVRNAISRRASGKETYVVADIERWRTRRRFDRAFSMETIYYAESPRRAVDGVFGLLNAGGAFFCGTDFYSDNRATARWQKGMGVRMHLLSRREWRRLFEGAGFSVRTSLVRDRSDRRAWRREFGTLFITGTKPARA